MPTPSNLAETAQQLRACLSGERSDEEFAFVDALIRHFELIHERPMQVEPWLWQSAMELAEAARRLATQATPRPHRPSSEPAR
ncbi:hypothetical protein [Nonomuraea sp. NPDC049784]|uniref:hypothetical protein n=1 Tax=Nonomuraea sp. NPDC049784 TaxID=3154361 RepID=UPI0033C4782F